MFRLALAALALIGSQSANSLTFRELEFICPIDGEKFKSTLAGSGTSYGQSLDLKPFGPTVAPWPLAKCPSNGFVMYKQEFSEDEIARLREYVNSDEYKMLKDTHSSYFLTASLRAHLGEKPAQLAYTLLQATWEAKSRSQYRQYAMAALDAYKSALAEPYSDPRRWINDQFVSGELERRLEQFDSARARFLSLMDREEVKTGIFAKILALQLQVIDAKDSGSKMVPRKNDAKK